MGSEVENRTVPLEWYVATTICSSVLWPYRLRRLGHHPFKVENPDRHRVGSPYGAVAQLGAQFPCKEKVVGSSPIGSTSTADD